MTTKPAGFNAFWDQVDADLAALPAAPESEISPLHSTDHSTTYKVRLTSVGPYRIEAFVSIPDGEGPFPALLLAPGYGEQGGGPADVRRIFGASAGQVLASSSRGVLRLGPDRTAMTDAVHRANDDLARALA